MEAEEFRFKKFSVKHLRSSMKVGVDAVLLGAWVRMESPKKILEVGSGCGVISLILAQRFPEAYIKGIDIDTASVEEARENFNRSAWKERLDCFEEKFPDSFLTSDEKYDLIISNPPYFRAGVLQPSTTRERARHQDSLSMFSLLIHGKRLLNEKGAIAMIFPTEFMEEVLEISKESGLLLSHVCKVRNTVSKKDKRVLMKLELQSEKEFKEGTGSYIKENLILFENGEPTEDYRILCKDFYLKF